jgi:hypothetical protein
MAFENSVAHSFTAASIRAHAPNAPGVYGISNAREWLFIGTADDIQASLFAHLQATDAFFAGRAPAGFVYEICNSSHALATRHDRLVHQYAPVCNQIRKA